MQIKAKNGRLIELPSDEEDLQINEGIATDADTFELNEQQFKMLRPVGRPKADETKERVTIRLSPEVVARFRATGKGWQSRMDAALKEFVHSHTTEDLKRLDK